jgi:hypothetical protein
MGSKHSAKQGNRPPKGEPWIWLTREMLSSPAWRALSPAALKVVKRVMLEHMAHACTANGNLVVTYGDFPCPRAKSCRWRGEMYRRLTICAGARN